MAELCTLLIRAIRFFVRQKANIVAVLFFFFVKNKKRSVRIDCTRYLLCESNKNNKA